MRGDYYAPGNNPGFQYLIGFDYENNGKKRVYSKETGQG
jgi:hypothetical protein